MRTESKWENDKEEKSKKKNKLRWIRRKEREESMRQRRKWNELEM